MHDKHRAARRMHRADEVAHKAITLVLVDANAVLHGDRHLHRIHHGLDAIGDVLGLLHQAGPKSTALHPVTGAAAVQVDFVIPPLRAQLRTAGQGGRIVATELQRHRMLFGVKAQMPLGAAVDDGAGIHHLGVQQHMATQQPVQVAAMAVRPVHHRRNGHTPGTVRGGDLGGFQRCVYQTVGIKAVPLSCLWQKGAHNRRLRGQISSSKR